MITAATTLSLWKEASNAMDRELTPEELTELEYLEGADAALKRAALRAREIARQTGTEVVYMRDGKIVRETPGPKPPE